MKNSQLMTTSHEIARNLHIEGSYSLRLSIAMKIAHQLNKLSNRISDNLGGYHVNINTDASIGISISPESIGNVSAFSQFVYNLTNAFQVETESEKFTRLAVAKWNAA